MWDANIFHPAAAMLTGSEAMFGVAVPLLPLQVFDPSAILLHQTALLLSFLITGWTTFALLRWCGASDLVCLAAAGAAMFMPWRNSVAGHIQLASLQWLPLIWLWVAKFARGEARRRHVPLLALVLWLQLTSSYYLAYLLSVSLASVLLALLVGRSFRWRDLLRLGAALGAGYAAFVLCSLPYLRRDSSSALVDGYEVGAGAVPPLPLLDYLENAFAHSAGLYAFDWIGWPGQGIAHSSVFLPLGVGLLSIAGLGLSALPALRRRARLRLPRGFEAGLWGGSLLGLLFASANARGSLGGFEFDLPLHYANEWLPGFRHLRAPTRWFFLSGATAPVLAGLGIARLERLFAARRPALRHGLRSAWLTLLLATHGGGLLPVDPAAVAHDPAPYQKLRELPDGALLELPWSTLAIQRVSIDSEYMLASTLHWKPILNGFTRFEPPTYPYLYRLGWRLPDAEALELLTRLTDLRWILLHLDAMSPEERAQWEPLVAKGTLRSVVETPRSWLLEVRPSSQAGEWTAALRSDAPRARTLTGLERRALRRVAGRIAVEVPESVPFGMPSLANLPITVRVANDSPRVWPGLDPQREGLVLVRTRILDRHDATVKEEIFDLHADLLPDEERSIPLLLEAPDKRGAYRLMVDLVQLRAGKFAAIGVPPVVEPLRVGPRRPFPPRRRAARGPRDADGS